MFPDMVGGPHFPASGVEGSDRKGRLSTEPLRYSPHDNTLTEKGGPLVAVGQLPDGSTTRNIIE